MSDSNTYVRKDDQGVMRVGETRVAFESVAAAFDLGYSPEMICQQYPSLTLESVYGAITWYLAHPNEAKAYLAQQNQLWEEARAKAERHPSPMIERLRKLREAEAAKS